MDLLKINYFGNIFNDFRGGHRWLLHQILLNYLTNPNMSYFYNMVLGITCRVVAGVIGINFFEKMNYSVYVFNILVICSFMFVGHAFYKKNEFKNRDR